MWDDVVHTCRHQRLFCSEDCVSAWLQATGSERGYVMDLGTLWRFAAHWYDGRMDRGYTRQEPAQAADWLRSAGPAALLGTVPGCASSAWVGAVVPP
jgi:Alkylmercury lyase